ncbi:MAG: metallophosphoesterase [Fimbriiglobus sp.]
MPSPDRMLTTLRRAVEFVRATPGRTGHLVRLPADAEDVFVAGDLHGHVDNFKTVLNRAALAAHPRRHLILQEVIHGPFRYPDGSDKSHQLVDLFAALKCQYPGRVHLLPGNHEMAQWAGRPVGKGDSGESQNDAFRRGVEVAYGAAATEVYAAYLTLFRACPLAVRAENGAFFCHTLPAAKWLPTFDVRVLEADDHPDTEFRPGGSVYALLWGRDTSEATADRFAQLVGAEVFVTGHIKTDAGFEVPNHRQLIVDCCGSPAAAVLVPADRPVTVQDLAAAVQAW